MQTTKKIYTWLALAAISVFALGWINEYDPPYLYIVPFGGCIALILFFIFKDLRALKVANKRIAEMKGFVPLLKADPAVKADLNGIYSQTCRLIGHFEPGEEFFVRKGIDHQIIQGEIGLAAADTDKNSRSINASIVCVIVHSTRLSLPPYCLKPKIKYNAIIEKLIEIAPKRLTMRLALMPVEIPEDPVFNAKFSIQGKDPSKIKPLFSKEITSFISSHPNLAMDGANNTFVVYWHNSLTGSTTLEDAESSLHQLHDIADKLLAMFIQHRNTQ